jgi:hypothetical protein
VTGISFATGARMPDFRTNLDSCAGVRSCVCCAGCTTTLTAACACCWALVLPTACPQSSSRYLAHLGVVLVVQQTALDGAQQHREHARGHPRRHELPALSVRYIHELPALSVGYDTTLP